MDTPSPNIHTLAAYLRDSGGEGQELSVSQQEAALKDWAAQNGYVITQWFKDEARPGSSVVGRDGFQTMMSHFRGGATEEGVVIWKMSRFARDIDDSQFYKADLRRRGYKVISINDNIPEGPEGRFFEAAIDWMNERFLEDLSRDVTRGLENLVRVYGAIPGIPPRGFKRQPVELPPRRDGHPHVAHKWVPDPEWIPRIQQAFAMRATGAPLAQIATETKIFGSLNSYKTFFSNKLYIGVLEYGNITIENYCEPMIESHVWDAVQVILKKNATHANLKTNGHPRRQNSKYLLSGLVYCAKCGSPLYGANAPQRSGKICDRYACTRAMRRRDCVQKNIPMDLLENTVLEALQAYALAPENLQAIQAQMHQSRFEHQVKLDQQRDEIRTRLAGVRRRLNNIAEAIAETGNARILTEKVKILEAEEAGLIADLAKIDQQAGLPLPEFDAEQIKTMGQALVDDLRSKDNATVRRVLRGLVSKIIVDRDGTKVIGMITYYFPPSDFSGPAPPERGIISAVPISRTPLGAPPRRHTFTHQFTAKIRAYNRRRS